MSELRIGEFARRVGVPASSLRAWERRYGLLSPARSVGGFRLYGEADAERVTAMLGGMQRGLSAAEAAAAAMAMAGAPTGAAGGPGARSGKAPSLPAARAQLADAISRYDEAAVHTVLDEVLAAFGLEIFLTELVLPTLSQIGAGRQEERAIGHEHFASNLVRARLLALARFWGRGGGPLALLACVSGEQHDISLIAFGLLLRTYGWRIVFLGADTPASTVRQAIVATRPTVTVLNAFAASLLESQGSALRQLAQETSLLLSGPGSTEAVARQLGLRRLDGDLPRAARELAEMPWPAPATP